MAILAAFAIAFLFAAFEAWIIMLLLGAVHHDVWSDVPALGFWGVLLVLVLINLIVAFVRGPSYASSR